MARYLLTKPATSDLREIVAYIRQRSPAAAARVRREILAGMRKVAAFPGMGHAHAGIPDAGIRVWSVYDYLIIYRHETKPVQVLRVLHGARDLGRLFEGG